MQQFKALTPAFIRTLELFRVRARRAFLGTRQGGHLSPKRGHGIEFSEYRQYELGDNPRHIDWGVFGRTERLYVKRFQEEQDLRVLVAIDTSASMGAVPSDGKWERACEIGLSLGYIALLSQDTVTISALGKATSPAFIGSRAFQPMIRWLSAISPSRQGTFARDVQRAAAQIRFPGVAVVISDFLFDFDEIERGLNILRAKNLDITVVQVLGESDRTPFVSHGSTFNDSETQEEVTVASDPEFGDAYRKLLLAHSERIQAFCASARIGFVLALPEEDLGDWVQEALPGAGLV
jgi:uncharacterized protein (DUF58 family)